jgi:uncharacterized protein YjbI with pentapeptide repeats
MANNEHLQILDKGVETWNQWRRDNPDQVPNFSGRDFRYRYLCSADLSGAYLINTNLRDAYLIGADLRGSYLINANLSGAYLSGVDFRGANLSGVDLSDKDLSGANLRGADLHNTNLSGATLRGVDLSGTDLSGKDLRDVDLHDTNLRGATLRGVDLRGATLRGANLSGIDLSSANLSGTNLSGKDLSGANLSGANLSDIVIFDTDFIGTNFTNANLIRSRFVGCDLSDAVVENTNVTDTAFQRLRGLPKPPEQLRIRNNAGEVLLTGSNAREFFHVPAIIEVYMTGELSQQEFGCYHFHHGEMYHEGVATGVDFIGHRHENGCSVLRFQAKSYEAIYQVLPDLLAPFPMTEAIDWEKSIQTVPVEKRRKAISALVKMETKRPIGRWRFAERMAEVFRGYRLARVYRISEDRHQGLRIDIFTDPQISERLLKTTSPELSDTQQTIRLEISGSTVTLQVVGRK